MLFNIERARGLMTELGVDVLIATTPENVTYLSGYSPWGLWIYRGNTSKKGTQGYAIFPRDPGTSPALVPASSGYTTFSYLALTPSWIKEYYPYESRGWLGDIPEFQIPSELLQVPEVSRIQKLVSDAQSKKSPSPGHALVRALKDIGITKGVLALDTEGISPSARERLSTELPNLQLKDGCELFRLIRAVKTPEEIGHLRSCAAINETAFQGMLQTIRPGITERQLVSVHRAITVAQGGIPTFLNVPAGPRSGLMWEPSDNVLHAGDTVWMDGGCQYRHYYSDTGFCAVLGEPTKRMREIYASVEAGINAACERIKPGAMPSVIYEALHEAIRRCGVERPFAMGHGIGIEERDHPIIQKPFPSFDDGLLKGSYDMSLETGMVINIEVNHWEFGVGGLKSEISTLVTPSGWELLTPQERKMNVIA